MKRSLAIVISIAFLGTSLSVPAFAAVKAGATCPKAGKTSVASGKTFTCVKSRKKLTWHKGVAVAKPVAAQQPNAAPKVQVAGGPCSTVGESQKNSLGYLECREIADNKKVYFNVFKLFWQRLLKMQILNISFEKCKLSFRLTISCFFHIISAFRITNS